jgi:hypothetical protein
MIAIQRQQIGFFRGLWETLFCVDNVTPASLSANGEGRFLSFLDTQAILPRGESHLMNFHFAIRSPDHEIGYIGV